MSARLEGHTAAVWSVALSADGRLVASEAVDGTLRSWDAQRQVQLPSLRPDRLYERMDITGLTGLTDAQRDALRALGAVGRGAVVSGA